MDIDIDIDKVILENIDIDMVILENIDIDKAILQNIDIDKISNRFKFGISNRATFKRLGNWLLLLLSLNLLKRLACLWQALRFIFNTTCSPNLF